MVLFELLLVESMSYGSACISLGDSQNAPTRWVLALFVGFLNFWSAAPNFRSVVWGGMCILFEICEKRPFQKCMGWGRVGCHTFEHKAGTWTMHGSEHCTGDHRLFRFRIVVIVAPLHKDWDPVGAHITLLVNGDIFLQFFSILQLVCLHRHPPCVEAWPTGC